MAHADSSSLQNTHILWQFFKQITRSFTDRRFSLWIALVLLVVALLVTLVWLAGRYEASQYQDELDRDTADAAIDIRNGFDQNVLLLQNLNAKALSQKLWQAEITDLLSQNRDWLRVEKRDLATEARLFQ
jgi:two-component system sensor histidine kinase DctS